jgi:hypothetical protein
LVPGRARPVANPYRWTCFDKRDGEFGEGGLTVARPSLCVTTPHREHQPPRVEEIADPEHDLELLERLREEVVRPGRQRSPLRVERRVCREHRTGTYSPLGITDRTCPSTATPSRCGMSRSRRIRSGWNRLVEGQDLA